jgi:hypothetical protein
MVYLRTLFALLPLIIGSLISEGALASGTSDSHFSARVRVTVTADESIKGMVSSYLNRELRSLGDVELVDDNPEYEIRFLAVETKSLSGQKTGVAFSVITSEYFDNQSISFTFQPKYKEMGLRATAGLEHNLDHRMEMGSTSELEKICKEIVADLDAKTLGESRRSFREMKEILKEAE